MEGLYITNTKDVQLDTKPAENKVPKTDSGIQTDTHFVESYIDKSYEWNEWVLRKKALQLADLCGKATHSSQTNSSYWRNEGSSQASVTRNNATQTSKEQSTTTSLFPTYK